MKLTQNAEDIKSDSSSKSSDSSENSSSNSDSESESEQENDEKFSQQMSNSSMTAIPPTANPRPPPPSQPPAPAARPPPPPAPVLGSSTAASNDSDSSNSSSDTNSSSESSSDSEAEEKSAAEIQEVEDNSSSSSSEEEADEVTPPAPASKPATKTSSSSSSSSESSDSSDSDSDSEIKGVSAARNSTSTRLASDPEDVAELLQRDLIIKRKSKDSSTDEPDPAKHVAVPKSARNTITSSESDTESKDKEQPDEATVNSRVPTEAQLPNAELPDEDEKEAAVARKMPSKKSKKIISKPKEISKGSDKPKAKGKMQDPSRPIEDTLFSLNAGLGTSLLHQAGQRTGRLLLSPQVRQDLERAKELQRMTGLPVAQAQAQVKAATNAESTGRQRALLAEPESPSGVAKILSPTAVEPMTPNRRTTTVKVEGPALSPLGTPEDRPTALSPSAEVVAKSTADAAGGSINVAALVDPVAPSPTAPALTIDAATVDSFMNMLAAKTAQNADQGDNSSEDGFNEQKSTDGVANSQSKPFITAIPEAQATSEAPTIDKAATAAASAAALLPSCPYMPALVKYIGHADDMEHALLAVSQGVLFVRVCVGGASSLKPGTNVNMSEHSLPLTYQDMYAHAEQALVRSTTPATNASNGLLAKFDLYNEYQDCHVLQDPTEPDQLYIWHRWHGLLCVRVALEDKVNLLNCIPPALMVATPELLDSDEPTTDSAGRLSNTSHKKKDFVSANKNVKADNLHFKHTAPQPATPGHTVGWSVAQPHTRSKAADTSHAPATHGLRLTNTKGDPKGINFNNVAGTNMALGLAAATFRRRSVEYLLQGVGAAQSDLLQELPALPGVGTTTTESVSQGVPDANTGDSADAVLLRGLDVGQANSSANWKTSAFFYAQYSAKGNQFISKVISRRRVQLLCDWLNTLQLQPVLLTPENLHENLCSGLLLADLLRLLVPGSSEVFSHLHIPALSRNTALSNLEQCMGVVLRNRLFVFSERIPKPIELLEACGSGGVGHSAADAQLATRRAFHMLGTFLDEIFRAFVMTDFVGFSVHIPSMVSSSSVTISSINQQYRAKAITPEAENVKQLTNADRYKAGGAWNTSTAVRDARAEAGAEMLVANKKKSKDAARAERQAKRDQERQEKEKMKRKERRVSTFGTAHCTITASSLSSIANEAVVKARRRSSAAAAGVDMDTNSSAGVLLLPNPNPSANVPYPTTLLLDMLLWYQSILRIYHRGFAPTLAKYLKACKVRADSLFYMYSSFHLRLMKCTTWFFGATLTSHLLLSSHSPRHATLTAKL